MTLKLCLEMFKTKGYLMNWKVCLSEGCRTCYVNSFSDLCIAVSETEQTGSGMLFKRTTLTLVSMR